MKSPHILLASGNPYRLIKNLAGLIDGPTSQRLEHELTENCKQLVALGENHLSHARAQHASAWRHIISRLYYAAFNMNRAVRLLDAGEYSTEVADHKNIGKLPSGFPNGHRHANLLPSLRDDRNLCDYDHSAIETDLLNNVAASLNIVDDFHADLKKYFASKGVPLP